MRIGVPVLAQDPRVAEEDISKFIEICKIEGQDFFLDGPVTRQLAVLDFDHDGILAPGVPFLPRRFRNYDGKYRLPKPVDIHSLDFLRANVFGSVAATMEMFMEKDVLGRSLTWAFGAPQLFIIPRAGQWANAFYERESHSLQFFFFPSDSNPENTIYTSLSHDIVTHETAHAILDGVARDLYNAVTPESLALHEAIADLVAAVMAFRSKKLRSYVLTHSQNSIRDLSLFSSIAEEFGAARLESTQVGYLRSLVNRKTLDPEDKSLDEFGAANYVAGCEPHELSQVLSGALYNVMVKIFESRRRFTKIPGKALWEAAEQFKRTIFRALDYLPPGEISFLDYARALIAADLVCNPHETNQRLWFQAEFLSRRIAATAADLHVPTNFVFKSLENLNLQTLVESDWAAYQFANNQREFLNIPSLANIYVRPRLDVTRRHFHHGGQVDDVREVIFKVSWDEYEQNDPSSGLPLQRQITVGTTLAIDWETRRVRVLLTSRFADQRENRNRMLQWMLNLGLLQVVTENGDQDVKEFRPRVRAEVLSDTMRVRGSARLLHIDREADYDR